MPRWYNFHVGKQQPSPPQGGADITIPIAGEHFGVGIPIEQQTQVERRKHQRNLDDGSPHPLRRATDRPGAQDPNASGYRLRSRSEQDYPEAYLPVPRALWEELTPAQREKAIHLQAVAMEKVGFEKGTPKFFIEDFDPNTGQVISHPTPVAGPTPASAPASLRAYPVRGLLGGLLLGAGSVLIAAAVFGQLTPVPVYAGTGSAAFLLGLLLAASARD